MDTRLTTGQQNGQPQGRLCSLAAGTILDVAPTDAPRVAAEAGWAAVGIWFDPATWTDRTTSGVTRALADSKVVALDMEPVIFGPDGDPGDALIDAAIGIGARNVLVASRMPTTPALIERFGALCDRAAAGNVTVVLEFLPIFAIRTLQEALHVVRAAARPNSGVLVDTLHLARSGGTTADLLDAGAAMFPYLQLADAPLEPPEEGLSGLLHEALHGRLLPGDGQLPLAAVLAAVPDVAVSVELRSQRLRADYPDPVDRARAVLAATSRVVG
jgi:sugar phosphate isomerase/epimerase